MKIYTIVHTFQDYAYPDSGFTHIRCSTTDLERARKEVEAEVREAFDKDEWEDDESYEEFIRMHFRSEDCWAEETCEDYVEINIVENELVD